MTVKAPGLPLGGIQTIPFAYTSRQLGQIVTNSTTETAFLFQSVCVIPANTLKPTDSITVKQNGVYQSGVTQSVQPWIRLGPAATALSSRAILATTGGAVSGLLNAAVDTPWAAITDHTIQSNGTSIVSGGQLFFATGATAALTALVASAAPVTFDPTVDNVLTASAAWSAASTANQIRAITWTAVVTRSTV